MELVQPTPQKSHARTGAVGVWPQAPGKGHKRRRARRRRPRANERERCGTVATQRIRGQRAHKHGSTTTEHERGAASRALAAQATRWEREGGQEGKKQDETVKYVPSGREQRGGRQKNGAWQQYA